MGNDYVERLRVFAFHEHVSESVVIEFALVAMFLEPEPKLGQRMRDEGLGLRRR
jgi:hypothetical protein